MSQPMDEQPEKEKTEPIIIERPNTLKPRLAAPLDDSIVKRAEEAVHALSGDFRRWLESLITELCSARAKLGEQPAARPTASSLYALSLEIKSLGEMYGYPLITRFAHSLCRLLLRLPGNRPAPMVLIDAHLDAMRAAIRTDMMDAAGVQLATELEKQVSQLIAQDP